MKGSVTSITPRVNWVGLEWEGWGGWAEVVWPGTDWLYGLERVTAQAPLWASGVSVIRWLVLVSGADVCGARVLPYTALGPGTWEQAGHRPQTSQRGVYSHSCTHALTHSCIVPHVHTYTQSTIHSHSQIHTHSLTCTFSYTHTEHNTHTHTHIHALTSSHTRLAVVCGEAHFSLCSAQHRGPLESSTATL